MPMYQLEVHCFTFELKKHLDQSDTYAKILKMKVERGLKDNGRRHLDRIETIFEDFSQ